MSVDGLQPPSDGLIRAGEMPMCFQTGMQLMLVHGGRRQHDRLRSWRPLSHADNVGAKPILYESIKITLCGEVSALVNKTRRQSLRNCFRYTIRAIVHVALDGRFIGLLKNRRTLPSC